MELKDQESSSKKKANDNDMAMLQESFDSCTRVTTQIKKLATELLRQNRTTTSSELAQRGISLCKDIVEVQNKIEQYMLTPPEELLSSDVNEALEKAAPPYHNLICFYNELVAIYRHHCSGTSSSSSSFGGPDGGDSSKGKGGGKGKKGLPVFKPMAA